MKANSEKRNLDTTDAMDSKPKIDVSGGKTSHITISKILFPLLISHIFYLNVPCILLVTFMERLLIEDLSHITNAKALLVWRDMIFWFGWLSTSFVWTLLADQVWMGRRKMMILTMTSIYLCWAVVIIPPLTPLKLYTTAYIQGTMSGGLISVSYVYLVESIPPSEAMTTMAFFDGLFSLNVALITGLGMFGRWLNKNQFIHNIRYLAGWRGEVIPMLLPSLIVYIALILVLPESNQFTTFKEKGYKANPLDKYRKRDKSSNIIFSIVLAILWLSWNMLYFGLLQSAGNFGHEPYTEVALLSLFTMFGPSIGGLLAKRFERANAMLVCVMGILIPMIGVVGLNYKTIFAIGAMTMVSGLTTIIYLFTIEAYPTKVRVFALSIYSNFGRLANVLMIFIKGELGVKTMTVFLISIVVILFPTILTLRTMIRVDKKRFKTLDETISSELVKVSAGSV